MKFCKDIHGSWLTDTAFNQMSWQIWQSSGLFLRTAALLPVIFLLILKAASIAFNLRLKKDKNKTLTLIRSEPIQSKFRILKKLMIMTVDEWLDLAHVIPTIVWQQHRYIIDWKGPTFSLLLCCLWSFWFYWNTCSSPLTTGFISWGAGPGLSRPHSRRRSLWGQVSLCSSTNLHTERTGRPWLCQQVRVDQN